jgi:hypothetical protein
MQILGGIAIILYIFLMPMCYLINRDDINELNEKIDKLQKKQKNDSEVSENE